jgi:tRNA(His) guanylyltransferase
MPDALGARMKEDYEFRARTYLPRRTISILRLDGRAFHQYTRGLDRPYDQQFMADMTAVAVFLCQEIQGCQLAYTQSDEISLILTDYQTPQTQAWFNGNVQKMVSVSAALATAKFNELRPGKLAVFDSRAFTIPDPVEVHNYLVWRQLDATRNSINMAAQAHFPYSDLHRKSSGELQEMLWAQHDVNWNDYDPRFKRGTVVVPETRVAPVVYVDRRSGLEVTAHAVERRVWTTGPATVFTKAPGFVLGLLAGEDTNLVNQG